MDTADGGAADRFEGPVYVAAAACGWRGRSGQVPGGAASVNRHASAVRVGLAEHDGPYAPTDRVERGTLCSAFGAVGWTTDAAERWPDAGLDDEPNEP